MRIALTGVHCTGKTTLVQHLQKDPYFAPFTFKYNITRGMQEAGLIINEDGNTTTQLLIIGTHIQNLLHPNLVTDRCLIDSFVYTKWLHTHDKVPTWVSIYARHALEYYKDYYDIFFYIEPELPLIADGKRSTDKAFRDSITFLFEKEGLPLYVDTKRIVRVSGSITERLQLITNTVKTWKKS